MQRFTRAALTLAAFASLLGAATPPDPEFAPLGGSFGQTMRVLVSAAPPDPCVVMVGLHPSENPPPDPDRTFTVAPGQSAFFDIELSRLAPRFGVRVELRPVVRVLSGKCSAAVEVFENFTFRTTAYMRLFTARTVPPPEPGTPAGSPPPEPDFAPLGVAGGQIVRMAVARGTGIGSFPPDPCRGVLAFTDAQGNRVGSPQAFNLAPGQIAFLDVNPNGPATNLFAPRRTTIQPKFVATSVIGDFLGSNLAGCQASVQLYDQLSGWSTEAVSGR